MPTEITKLGRLDEGDEVRIGEDGDVYEVDEAGTNLNVPYDGYCVRLDVDVPVGMLKDHVLAKDPESHLNPSMPDFMLLDGETMWGRHVRIYEP